MGASETHTLSCKDLVIGYGRRTVLSNIDVEVKSGELLCLLGPNGVGKSTLFKTLLGLIPKLGGTIEVDGVSAGSLTRRQFAQNVAYVPQTHNPAFPYSVTDMVLTGAVARTSLLGNPSSREYDRVNEVLSKLDIADLASRPFTELSGGEQQMTLIARSLMQNSNIVLMDEPTAALDLANQVSVLDAVRGLAESGHGVVMVTHDPDQCFLCATHVLLVLRNGEIVSGPVDEVVTEANLKRAYGVDVSIVESVDDRGRPVRACVPSLADERAEGRESPGKSS